MVVQVGKTVEYSIYFNNLAILARAVAAEIPVAAA